VSLGGQGLPAPDVHGLCCRRARGADYVCTHRPRSAQGNP